MEAELRDLFSADVDDLRSYTPGEVFCVWARAIVGPKGATGEESFDFAVCSPAWLAQEAKRQKLFSGRFHLVAERFEYSAVEEYVRNQVALATGASWREVATKLSRFARWEFEDYVE